MYVVLKKLDLTNFWPIPRLDLTKIFFEKCVFLVFFIKKMRIFHPFLCVFPIIGPFPCIPGPPPVPTGRRKRKATTSGGVAHQIMNHINTSD